MMGFREKYRRLNLDKSSQSQPLTNQVDHEAAKEAPENNVRAAKTPLGSIMSITHMDELVNRLKRSRESDL